MAGVPLSLTFRRDIQGLRAIAVALVLLSHGGVAGFEGGFIGVDVFFVLSGYLITGLLIEESLSTGSIRYGQFLARRLRRLLPAMLVMLLVVLVVASIVLTAFEMRMQARSFPYAATWISNFFFAFVERDYFVALQENDLFLHTWSLGVEEQFYLLWPWLVLLLAGFKATDARRPARGRAIVAALAVICAVSFAVCVLLTEKVPLLAFYMMPARIWQFALGAVVYVGLHIASDPERLAASPRVGLTAAAAGALLVLGAATLLDGEISYPGWYALAPSVGAALIIAGGTAGELNAVTRLLGKQPMVWVGDRSYSIYLWHWPVLIVGGSLGIARSFAGLVALVSLTLALAALSYRYIERPFWKGRYRNAAPRRVMLAATLSIAFCILPFNLLGRHVYDTNASIGNQQGYDPRMDADSRVYAEGRGCDTWHFAAYLVPCPLGNRDGTRLAFLVGDSIGAQWSPLVSSLLSDSSWQIIVLTKSSCAIVDRIWHYDVVGGDYVVCAEWRNRVLRYIDEVSPDIVFIGSASTYRFTRSDWVDGTAGILDRVAAAAGSVVLLPGTPALSFDGPSCLEDPWRFSFRLVEGERECEETRTDERPETVAAYLGEAARAYDNVVVLNLIDLVCPGGRCAASTPEGVAVFRDNQHLTASFALSLVPAARERLASLGLSPTPPAPGNAPQ
jgi:peptidoglycan/LPS O-acetylase OafA/YrhL